MNPGTGHAEWLDRWLELLDTRGFRVGVRERLLVQRFLAQRAAAADLADDPRVMLASIAPLLCASAQQQATYRDLLQAFHPERPERAKPPPDPGRAQDRRVAWLVLFAAALLMVLLVAIRHWPPQTLENPPAPEPPASAPSAPSAAPPEPLRADVYLDAREMKLGAAEPVLPGWATPLRLALVAAGVLALAAAVISALRRLRRDAVLAHARTTDQVDEHLLHAGPRTLLGPAPALARVTARALRQRVAGDGRTLDLPATLQATVRAAGALSPRWRTQRRTPDYLVLIDRLHPRDHAVPMALDAITALAKAGVVVDTWYFEGSPEHGLWSAREGARRNPRTPFAEIAARHAGQRLLVWAEASALVDASGRLLSWTRALPLLGERAWFTPLPIQAWAGLEDAVDAQGFLLLPALPGALPALAGWLTGGRAVLDVPGHWPLLHPALLRDAPASWVARSAPPPPAELDELHYQLRSALGPQRHLWLCGCAIFPVLAPTLTLELGRAACPGASDDELAAGYFALAALPWFRHGRMPDWLREELLQRLPDASAERLRAVVTQRLDRALQPGGERLAEIATRRAWLRAATGMAQDVLLARFLEEGEVNPLLQQLPRTLRQALFRDGLLLRGLRPGAWALVAATVLVGAWAASPLWPDLRRANAVAPLLVVLPMLNAPGAGQLTDGRAVAFGPDGTQVVGDGAPAPVWDARTGGRVTPLDPLMIAVPQREAQHPQGGLGARIIDGGRVQLERLDGPGNPQPVGLPLAGSDAVALDFSPDGERLAVRSADHSIRIYGAAWGRRLEVVVCDDQAATMPDWVRRTAAALEPGPAAPLVVGYRNTAWRSLGNGSAPPAAGELQVGPSWVDAEALRARLETTAGRPVSLRRDGATPDRAIWAVCDTSAAAWPPPLPAIPGLDAAAVQRLDSRVAALFTPAGESALQALLTDAAQVSDAMTLAVRRAVPLAKGLAPAGVDRTGGLTQTLRLAEGATPATLVRLQADLEPIAAAAATLPGEAPALAQRLRDRLAAAGGARGLLYIQIADESQRPLGVALQEAARKAGFEAPGIELVGRRAPARHELRVQGAADRPTARRLVTGWVGPLPVPPVLSAIAPRATRTRDIYELWLAPDGQPPAGPRGKAPAVPNVAPNVAPASEPPPAAPQQQAQAQQAPPLEPATGVAALALQALSIAASQVGVVESPPNSNSGPEVDRYLAAVGFRTTGLPWTQAFVFWSWQQAAERTGRSNPVPKTGGVLEAWRLAPDTELQKLTAAQAQADPSRIVPGAIFVMTFDGGGAGHTGLVERVDGDLLQTIEGNVSEGAGAGSNGGVFRKTRRLSAVNVGFLVPVAGTR